MGQCDVAIRRDDNALARGQAVVLHDVGRAELVERCLSLGGRRAHAGRRGRDVGGRHHVLREGLAALQLRGVGGRAEAVDACVADGVGDSRDKWRLGPDHDQLGAELLGQRGHGGAVRGVDAALLSHGGRPGVARCAHQRSDGRVSG